MSTPSPAIESAAVRADRLPTRVDLRETFERWGLSARRQGARGTCSVFTMAGALEYAFARARNRGARLSVEFLNWAAHTAVDRREDGGFFSEIWSGFEAYGICPESDCPYRSSFDADLRPDPAAIDRGNAARTLGLEFHWIKEWNVDTGLTAAELAEIRSVMANSWPVCGGFRWPKRAVWNDGMLQFCPPEDVFDGHSVLLVGYRDDPLLAGGGVFTIRNSGGDGSDGSLSYTYVAAYMNDAAWIGAQIEAPGHE